MTSKDEKSLYDTLEALSAGTDVPESEETFSLEEILAEYGAGREQKILRDVEEAVAPPEKPAEPAAEEALPEPDPGETAELARQDARNKLLAQAVDLEKLEKSCPAPPGPSPWRRWSAALWTR